MKIQTLLRHGRRNAPAPGTPAWRRYLTASKISAVMRTSPWQTRFQLWHEMAGNIEPNPPHPAVLERGHILEPAVPPARPRPASPACPTSHSPRKQENK